MRSTDRMTMLCLRLHIKLFVGRTMNVVSRIIEPFNDEPASKSRAVAAAEFLDTERIRMLPHTHTHRTHTHGERRYAMWRQVTWCTDRKWSERASSESRLICLGRLNCVRASAAVRSSVKTSCRRARRLSALSARRMWCGRSSAAFTAPAHHSDVHKDNLLQRSCRTLWRPLLPCVQL